MWIEELHVMSPSCSSRFTLPIAEIKSIRIKFFFFFQCGICVSFVDRKE